MSLFFYHTSIEIEPLLPFLVDDGMLDEKEMELWLFCVSRLSSVIVGCVLTGCSGLAQEGQDKLMLISLKCIRSYTWIYWLYTAYTETCTV